MGNCSVSIKRRTGLAPAGKCVIADITLSASYADAGDTLRLVDLGLTTVDAVILSGGGGVPAGGGADTTGRVLIVAMGANPTSDPKIAAYQQGAGAGGLTEVAATTNLSTITVRAIVYGDNFHGV